MNCGSFAQSIPTSKPWFRLLPFLPDCAFDRAIPVYGFSEGRGTPWADGIRNGSLKAVLIHRKNGSPQPEKDGDLPPNYFLVTAANLDEALKDQQL